MSEQKESFAHRVAVGAGHEIAGTAMIGGIVGSAFAGYAVLKGKSIKSIMGMAAGGTILGTLGGLGSGGMAFEGTFGKGSHVKALQVQRSQSMGAQQAR